MRRARFAKPVEQAQDGRQRTSVSEALWFDLRASETADDEALLSSRLDAFDHAPLLLGITHLLAGLTSLFLDLPGAFGASLLNPLLPITLLLLVDSAAWAALNRRQRWTVAPHVVIHALCGYIALTGLLWLHFGMTLAAQPAGGLAGPVLLVGAGVTMAAVVSVNSPPLAITNAIIAILGALLFGGLSGANAAGLSVCANIDINGQQYEAAADLVHLLTELVRERERWEKLIGGWPAGVIAALRVLRSDRHPLQATFEGRPLEALPLTERETRFAADFPGRIGRFRRGRGPARDTRQRGRASSGRRSSIAWRRCGRTSG